MKKLLIIILPVLLSGCSAFNQLVESACKPIRWNTSVMKNR